MSKLDFNKAEDFAIATMSAANELLAAFTRDRQRWSISEGTYKGGRKSARLVPFLVFKSKSPYQAAVPTITDTAGRRVQKFYFPYVDGQTTDDLGRRGEDFDVEILFYGPVYKLGMDRFLNECNDPIPGTLEHPIRGTIRAKPVELTLTHSHSTKNAVLIHCKFTEHNFEGAEIGDLDTVVISTKSALQKVLAALRKVAAAIAAVRQIRGLIQSAIVSLRQKIQEFYTLYQTLAVDAGSAFGLTGFDIGPILPINLGGSVAPATGGRTAGGVNPNADPGTFGADATSNTTTGNAGLRTTTGGFVLVSTRFTTVVQSADPFANIPVGLLSDIAREAIEQTQIARRVETLRAMVDEMAADIDALMVLLGAVSLGQLGAAAAAALTLNDTKLTLLNACDAMAGTLRAGLAGGRPSIVSYTVPRPMSIREAAFIHGLSPQEGADIAGLNPDLESVNNIPAGAVILVPTFS